MDSGLIIVIIIIIIIVVIGYFIFIAISNFRIIPNVVGDVIGAIADVLPGPSQTPGAFRDPTLNQCFTCPEGMDRTIGFPSVTGPRACNGSCSDVFPNRPGVGSFEDGVTGICYHCPQGMIRSKQPIPITNGRACVATCENFPGGFEDIIFPGCYSCPRGFERTVVGPISDPLPSVNSPNACTTTNNFLSPRRFSPATRLTPTLTSPGILDGSRFASATPVP